MGQLSINTFKKFSHLLEHLNTAIVLLNSENRIQYINPAAEVLFSLSIDRILNQPTNALLHNQKLLQKLENSLQHGNAFTQREIRLIIHGEEIIVDITVTPFTEKKGSIELLLEITPQNRYLKISKEEMLFSQQQVSRELLRSMAHEVKNPLGGIRGAAQLLEKELPHPDLVEYTQVIIEEVDRLKTLVDRMLGPKSLPNKQSINIHNITERVRQIINADKNFDIKILFDYDPSIPELYADPEHLIQTVLNLVKNAAQALTEWQPPKEHIWEKSITLKTRIKRHYTIGHQYYQLILKLDIIDTGPGIKKELMEHIFMPLITGRASGTGLGLSIAQSLINQNDGLIECNSEMGRTVFSILLPIKK